ncbi:MAG: pyridine nucleotide-disulfide oxidoreductase [Ramlibacter sp.]|jgi:3-phenylpropionate/trans-cinnamate dioxygenase ferredoxin reductase subunit|uniref:NAD(P)/FAD-dependent oxidoreductase n=1 Tax=Ramlibacter sp. TaxID=1917967 RepID=UPI0026338DB3|nr:FAD-dependent oxidoreductase [Ramlibacter sp.]MDB5750965.1 pyridine nucleotide-disulfide oxidoreductase [Ramlibacter sp.]
METSNDKQLLIVGAGHAGSELAIAARNGGWSGGITLLWDETALPYHRPPLSKAYLAGKADAESLALRPRSSYDDAKVTLRPGARMQSIDRGNRRVTLADGTVLPYDKLALCTGGRPRPLACSGLPAGGAANLLYLRTLADAEGIRLRLVAGSRLVVIGGGYIGLEVAASARAIGAEVTLLEAQPRVLARVAGAEISAFYESVHRDAGVDLRTGVLVEAVEMAGDQIVTVLCAGGERVPADLVVAGLGMLVNVEAAQAAGIATEAGIPVDERACTADTDIVAAGDCTLQQSAHYARELRLESVPNALEQARAAAAWLCGKPKPAAGIPWFWSDQYDLKLQMAGLSQGHDRCILRGDPARRSFSAFYLQGNRLLAIDAVNRPAEFMLAKRLLGPGCVADPERLADETVPLKDLLAQA